MLRLYNTLTRQKDEIVPLNQGKVSMYTCGPTVYRYAHIGNMRSYMMADWIRRTLLHEGNEVTHIKNITDVGHMRQDMVERGEDKMIAAALSEGKTLDEIAMFYTNAFLEDELKLNILPAQVFPRATDHVTEMIEVTERLVEQGYGYAVEGNVYFDVSKYPNYGRLSGNQLDSLLQGVRVEVDPLKRNQTDFALWKAAEPGRMVKWPSPWGDGFPGWHIECTAMSTRYLGPQQDLHTGGVDNIFPHHEDELAQSEGASEGQYVRYWVHGQHLLADGLKMAKSTGNSYTISELEERGFEALAFRYLCATAHYRTRLNFTFTALRGAQHALAHLRTSIRQWARSATELSPEAMEAMAAPVRERFWNNVYADLNVPAALAELWKVTGSSLPSAVKLQLITEFDTILGLGLAEVAKEPVALPVNVRQLVEARAGKREAAAYTEADTLRDQVNAADYALMDQETGTLALPQDPGLTPDKLVGTISSSEDIPSQLQKMDTCKFSINILAHNYRDDVVRCVESILKHCSDHRMEIIVVDSSSTDGAGQWADELAMQDSRVKVVHTDHPVGEGPGRNMGLRMSRGELILILDTSIEFTGDALSAIAATLEDASVGATGGWGVTSGDMRQFESADPGDVDAVEGYCLAFRREVLNTVGLLDEKFRFYRNLDLDFSIALKNQGFRNVMLQGLPLIQHEHRGWYSMDEDERDKLSKKNFYRFLEKWGHFTHLLLNPTEHHDD